MWMSRIDLVRVPGKIRGKRRVLPATRAIVDPPQVALREMSLATSATSLSLRGDATDDARVRDIVVHVRGPGTGRRERKLLHSANPALAGDSARHLAFATDVPLEPGSNLVTITSRDGDKVASEQRIWIYCHEAGEPQ